jgi:hypothetical protein
VEFLAHLRPEVASLLEVETAVEEALAEAETVKHTA